MVTNSACQPPPPALRQAKTALAVSGADTNGNFTSTYRITEHNSGGDGTYSLADTPRYDTNVTVLGAGISGQVATNYIGSGPYALAGNAAILAGSTHTYTVTVSAVYSAAVMSGTTNVSACGSGPGYGLYNEAAVSWGTNVVTNSACQPPPGVLRIQKSFLSASSPNGTGAFSANYRLTVHDSGGSTETYSLTDAPAPDTNITVSGATVTGQANATFVGAGPYVLASNVLIAAGATQTYTVQVTMAMSAAVMSGAVVVSGCSTNGPGAGLYNVATVVYGSDTVSADACGEAQPVGIRGHVYVDVNGDGIFDSNDTNGIQGVTVTLRDAASNIIATTVTSASGSYIFTNIAAGSYTIVETDLPGYVSTGDIIPPNDNRIPVTLLDGEFSTDNDFLDARLGAISGSVFVDVNGDGQIESADTNGIQAVTVSLLSGTNVIRVTTTVVSGAYTFTNVAPGLYNVVETDLPGYVSTGDSAPPNDDQIPVVLGSGQSSTGNNFLDAIPVLVSGRVILDMNGNGNFDPEDTNGINGVTVTLLGASSNVVGVVTTTVNGAYAFSNIPPGLCTVMETDLSTNYVSTGDTVPPNDNLIPVTLVSGVNSTGNNFLDMTQVIIGDYVWFDGIEPGPLADFVQGPGDIGPVSNATVRLYNATSNTLVATYTTTSNGLYQFTTWPGTYYVVFTPPPPTPSFSYQFVIPHVGTNGAVDSDADYISGKTTNITLQSGQVETNIDCGLVVIKTYLMLGDVNGTTDGGKAVLTWQTSSETGESAFDIMRRDAPTGEWVKVNANSLPAVGTTMRGAVYRYPDNNASAGKTYEYQIVSIDIHGVRCAHGPYSVTYPEGGANTTLSMQPVEYTATENPVDDATIQRYQQAAQFLSTQPSQPLSTSVVTAVKVAVTSDALYAISSASLATAFNTSETQIIAWLQARQLDVENFGTCVDAIYSTNSISFYGKAFTSLYTAQNIYWIKQSPGSVVSSIAAGSTSNAPAETFAASVKVATNFYMVTTPFANPTDDPWFGDQLLWYSSHKANSTTCSLLGAVSGSNIVVRLMGFDIASANPVSVKVNGIGVGTNLVIGKNYYTFTNSLAGVPINPRTNSVTITALTGYNRLVYLDDYTINYRRDYVSTNNELLFCAEGNDPVTVDGFSTNTIEVYDVSIPEHAVQVAGLSIGPPSNGVYRASFHPPTATGRYVAVAGGFRRTAAPPTVDQPSNLHDQNNHADYIVISTAAFASQAQQLVTNRQPVLDSMRVDLQDIYDEFNYGIADPHAIKAFLGYADRMWSRSPRYVVLLGKGNMDYRNYKGTGDCIVPPLVAGDADGLQASDEMYGDVNGDGGEEIAIGRIPILTAGEFSNIYAKIQAYETGGNWKTQLVALADGDPVYYQLFQDDSLYVASFAQGTSLQTVFGQGQSNSVVHNTLLNGLSAGRGLFTYFGHGDYNSLYATDVFSKTDVTNLVNTSCPPLLLAMTCQSGNFDQSGAQSLSEVMVVSTTGMVAVWAAGKIQDEGEGRLLGASIVSNLYMGHMARIGDALIAATHAATDGGYACQKYNFFGDPSLAVGDKASLRPNPQTPGDTPTYNEWMAWAFAPVLIDRGGGLGQTADLDGDGVSNWSEYMAGTDPASADSVLVFTSPVGGSGGKIVVHWDSSQHRVYELERCTNLLNQSFDLIDGDLPATPPVNVYTDTVNSSSIFIYRIRVK